MKYALIIATLAALAAAAPIQNDERGVGPGAGVDPGCTLRPPTLCKKSAVEAALVEERNAEPVGRDTKHEERAGTTKDEATMCPPEVCY